MTPSQFFISAACSCLKCSLGATLWNILRNLPLVFNTLKPLLFILPLTLVCCSCCSYNVRCWKAAREESELYENFLFIYIEIKLRLAVEIVAVALPRCCHVNPCNIFLSIPCTMESTTLGSTFQLQPQLAAGPAGRWLNTPFTGIVSEIKWNCVQSISVCWRNMMKALYKQTSFVTWELNSILSNVFFN